MIVVATMFLLFFRARYAFTVYSTGDDACYVRWLATFVGERTDLCSGTNPYAPGIALLWLPAGAVARLVQVATSLPFVRQIAVWVGTASFLYWAASFFLLDAIVVRSSSDRHASTPLQRTRWVIILSLAVPVLFYATNRTTLAHAGEWFLALLTVLLSQRGRVWPALAVASLLVLTRYNDAPALFMVIGSWLDDQRLNARPNRSAAVWVMFGGVVALFLVPLVRIAFFTGYNGVYLTDVIRAVSIERASHVLFGADWGLLWTAPWWLVGYGLGLARIRRLSLMARGALVWMTAELALCLGWGGAGSEFTYRYLIGSYAGALIVWLEVLRQGGWLSLRVFKIGTTATAIWLTYLAWIYKTTPATTLRLTSGVWANPSLQLEALRMLGHPVQWIRPIGLSPVPSVLYSWFLPASPAFSRYVLSQPALSALTVLTVAAAAVGGASLVFLVAGRRRPG